MGLTELTENDEGFFLNGCARGWIYKGNSRDLVLQEPIWGAFDGFAMRRFYLEENEPILYAEYKNSVTGKLMRIGLGEVKDKDIAETWIARVNKLYEEQRNS
ncbi:hypothetical protein HY449_04665 [Candidatus Pacearchaeota archaeon]|nr:hypothetical protein [Candidatus Pacearchaeota archaeon]